MLKLTFAIGEALLTAGLSYPRTRFHSMNICLEVVRKLRMKDKARRLASSIKIAWR